jgi:hypothetical protein
MAKNKTIIGMLVFAFNYVEFVVAELSVAVPSAERI